MGDATAPNLLQSMLIQSASTDPTTNLQIRKDELKSAPRFKRFDQVLTAFLGGLMPIMCNGNPRRLADYSAFIISVATEYSRHRGTNWPVFLRYIEETRRRALVIDGDSVPNVKDLRANHSLMGTSPPSNGKLLNADLIGAIKSEWPHETNIFRGEFVDEEALLPHPTSSSTSSSYQQNRPKQSPTSTNRTDRASHGSPFKELTEDEWGKVKLLTNICRNFLFGNCAGKCPRNLPHKSIEEVKKSL